ncbi:MAG: UbiA family prenyltransferase [Phycisphaerales bacterium]|nr:UbiA family prenyltransferase [Phycisphaerales bacterium]
MPAPAFQALAPYLHLTRLSTAFGALANVWFVVLWVRGVAPERTGLVARAGGTLTPPALEWPLWLVLAITGVIALALHGFSSVLNDTLDFRRDQALHPGRPLPSGRVHRDSAVVLIVVLLLLALAGASTLGRGSVSAAASAAGLILLFHAAAKHVPAVGFVVLGLAHAAAMLMPVPGVLMMWPLWLAAAHIGMTAAIAHRLARRRPRLSRRGLLSTLLVALVAGIVTALVVFDRTGQMWPDWVRWQAAASGGAAALAFALFATWLAKRPVRRAERRGERIDRAAALWAPVYAGAWCAGQEVWMAAIILGILAIAALVAMTVMREAVGLIESPPGWRS